MYMPQKPNPKGAMKPHVPHIHADHSLTQMSDHHMMRDAVPHSEHLARKFESIEGDGFTHPMRKGMPKKF